MGMARNTQSRPRNPFELRTIIEREYALFGKYLDLCRNPCDGIFVIPSDSSPSRWLCAVSVIGGLFDGGIFRFELILPENSTPPIVAFRPPIFHPMIDVNTGEFDTSKFKFSKTNGIREFLEYIKQCLLVPDVKGVKNPEAAELLAKDARAFRGVIRGEIARIAELLASESHAPSNSRLSFGSFVPEIHQPILQNLLESNSTKRKENPA